MSSSDTPTSSKRTKGNSPNSEAIGNVCRARLASPDFTANQYYSELSPRSRRRAYDAAIRTRIENEKVLENTLEQYDEDINTIEKNSEQQRKSISDLEEEVLSWETERSALQRKIDSARSQIRDKQLGIDRAHQTLLMRMSGKIAVEKELRTVQREKIFFNEELQKMTPPPEELTLPVVDFQNAPVADLCDFCEIFVSLAKPPSPHEGIDFQHLLDLKKTDLRGLYNTLSEGRIMLNENVKANFPLSLTLKQISSRQAGREGMLIDATSLESHDVAEIIAQCVGIAIPNTH